MSDPNTFTLGSLALSGWSPEEISYGEGHHVAVHDYLGGGRLYQIMAADPQNISFTGKLVGANRFSDRNSLEAMVGTQQTLTWDQDSEQVVVLDAKFKQVAFYIEYTVSCGATGLPQTSNAAPQPTQAAQGSAQAAQGFYVTDPSQSVSTPLLAALAALATVKAVVGAVTAATSATTYIEPLQTAQAAATALRVNAAANVSTFPGVANGQIVPNFASDLLSLQTNLAQVNNASVVASYLTLAVAQAQKAS